MFCTMLIYLIIANYDSLTCTSLSDPSFHYRNVCDKCSVHQFFFLFRTFEFHLWLINVFAKDTTHMPYTCSVSVIEYLHLSTIKTNTPGTVETVHGNSGNWGKTCSWPGHELLHTTIIIFFDSVLNDLTWPRYLLSSRIFYYQFY